MSATGRLQLNEEYLAGIARQVALEVASENQLFLAPEALPAVDELVKRRLDELSTGEFDLDVWKRHVRHISQDVAEIYKSRDVSRIVDPNDLLTTAMPVASVYPYE
jgi:hypothetical protein